MMMMGGPGGWIMMLFMVLFWGLIIGLAIWFLGALFPRSSNGKGNPESRSGDSAIEILRQRYARGELTRDQFEQMRHDLES